tara:strand:+ start:490 stop:2049 length:1560 start_codon:yes stop_codon:yes gene_type:complete
MTIFKEILKYNQGRLLNLYNQDTLSSKVGFGDRKYWAWKTIDFPNATFQSGVNALAISLSLGIAHDRELYFKIIDQVINAIPEVSNKNNSLNEAFPNENSYCVTALIAFDVLFAIDLLRNELSTEKKDAYFKIIKPLIKHILYHKEEHAIISNHLATGAAALYLWTELTGKDKDSYKTVLNLIFEHQSSEGWYMEYEGPDPGYQTLCTHYLSVLYSKTKDKRLKESLQKSLHYLYHFVHPDKTIGGLYGSRNTEVYYPGGLNLLASKSKEARHIALHLNMGVAKGNAVLPQDIDADNYVPLLNSYALAALYEDKVNLNDDDLIPFFKRGIQKNFEKSGIELFSNSSYFSILNYRKGGTLKVFNLSTSKCEFDSGGVFYFKNKKILTSQRHDPNIEKDNTGSFKINLHQYKEQYPSLTDTIIIRILALTVFRFIFLAELFKKLIVKVLMTNKLKSKYNSIVKVTYNAHYVGIEYDFNNYTQKDKLVLDKKLKAVHMASSGYFLKTTPVRTNQDIVKITIR